MRQNKFSVVLAIFITLSAGCATAPEKKPSELAGDHGYLTGAIHSKEIVGLELQGENGKRVSVYTDSTFLAHRRINTWIPTGKYQIVRMIIPGIVNTNLVTFEKNSLPEIELKAHGVTDLGNLVPVNLGGGAYTLAWQPRTDRRQPRIVQENLEIFDPNRSITWSASGKLPLGKISTGSTGLGLIADWVVAYGEAGQRGKSMGFDDLTHENALVHIQSFSSPVTPLYLDDAGSEYFGTTLGAIRYKTGDSWNLMTTGSLEAVTAVRYEASGHILAALESGELLESIDGGTTWKRLSTFGTGELAVDIRKINGILYVSTWIPDEVLGVKLSEAQTVKPTVKIYSIAGEQLEEIAVVECAQTLKVFASPRIENNATSLFVSMPQETLAEVNVSTGSVRKIDPPKKFTGFSYSAESDLMAVWLAGGMFSHAHFSDDLGNNWGKLPKPPYQPRDIYLETTANGYMWSLSANFNSTNYELARIDANKNRWEPIAESDKSCTQILSNFQHNQHYCVFPNGVLLELSNNK